MTSEFENNHSPDELKYLLVKWRYFYRLLYGRYERIKTDSVGEIEMMKNGLDLLNLEKSKLLIEIQNKDSEITSIKNKKLTWKERIKGRIIE
jgi:uncharacterized membrane protein YobD (UPF0266 family)